MLQRTNKINNEVECLETFELNANCPYQTGHQRVLKHMV